MLTEVDGWSTDIPSILENAARFETSVMIDDSTGLEYFLDDELELDFLDSLERR